MTPRLEKIIIGPARERLAYVESVIAVPGRGLVGDRYYEGKGSFNRSNLSQTGREVSIIAFEALTECNARIGSGLDFLDLRRNLVISGFDAEAIGQRAFWIGEVRFKINRTAPPCRYLARLLEIDIMEGLKYIGGYRADILTGGEIRVGDEIRFSE